MSSRTLESASIRATRLVNNVPLKLEALFYTKLQELEKERYDGD